MRTGQTMIVTLENFGSGITGKIDVRMPTNGQRMKLFEKANLDFMKLQNVADMEKTEQEQLMQKALINIIDDVGEFCQSIDLDAGGKKIKDFDELSHTLNMIGVQIQIATTVLMGSQLTIDKKKKKSAKQ